MGGCQSQPENKAQTIVNKQIDLQLRRDKKVLEYEVKLLLLGAGESGKSTIAKQMKIAHLDGFSQEEKESYKDIISSNVIMSMRSLVIATQKFPDHKISADLESKSALFVSNTILFDQELTPELAEAVKVLWQDPAIRHAFKHSSQFQLNDSSEYYFECIDRISQPNYSPTPQDILHARARTTGISEVSFFLGDVRFRMVDVGGQRSERKKWIHCFQDVTAIIFCVAMSEYDLKLYEDETVNRMHESIMLFEEICNCQWFVDTSLILFFNKSDLFKKKIVHTDLNVCFSGYTGGCDYKNATEFMKEKFVSLNKNKDKTVYCHFTVATDTENITFVINSIRDIILRNALSQF